MFPKGFIPNFAKSPHTMPFWSSRTSSKYIGQIPTLKFEEEEEEGAWYTNGIPEKKEIELLDGWVKFYRSYEYPLYFMIVATEADETIALLMNKHREELSAIAGDKCCHVYFRDIEKAKRLEPFNFTEHSKRIMQLIKIIEIHSNNLPCILFFEQLTSGKYVLVGIENKSVSELIRFLRELFTYIYSKKNVSLSAIKTFKTSTQLEITRKVISKNLIQFSREMVSELIKSLTKLP
jgi:hypothetical protein